jgi:Lon protease-like protein
VEPVETELPLFPLQTVLLPGGPLALRVFESRYLDMVARCLRGSNRFGVVAIRQGLEVGAVTPYEAGTTAEIVDWHAEPGGLLGIRVIGREGFRLVATRREADGLYLGRVTLLEPLAPMPLAAEHASLVELLRQIIPSLPLYRDLPSAFDDAVWVAERLIELLPFPLARKQALLETRDAEQRLTRLAAELRTTRRQE